MVCYRILTNGLIVQWGTVTHTGTASDWLTQTLPLAYSNASYKIFLQGKSRNQEQLTPVVRDIEETPQSFKYFWGSANNNINYFTIGY